jgi:hypothetical protein
MISIVHNYKLLLTESKFKGILSQDFVSVFLSNNFSWSHRHAWNQFCIFKNILELFVFIIDFPAKYTRESMRILKIRTFFQT